MTTRQRILAVLNDYAPLPLSIDDLADETGRTRRTIQTAISDLLKDDLIRRETTAPTKGRDITRTLIWLQDPTPAEAVG